jgi:uncharacterized RDD family membrane protein YckC
MENLVTTTDLPGDQISFPDFYYASSWQRFFNYFIDNIIISYGLGWVTGAAVGFVVAKIDPEFAYRTFVQKESLALFYTFMYLIAIINYLFYYTVCEKLFNGFTLAKLITGTKAVKISGEKLTARDALLRSLSRIVPFKAFSGFGGHPWHDTWTDTMVFQTR